MTLPTLVEYLYHHEHWSPRRIGWFANRQELHICNMINNNFRPTKRQPMPLENDPPWMHDGTLKDATDPATLLQKILEQPPTSQPQP